LTVNIGMVWQLALIWKNPDAVQRAKAAGGAMIIGVVAFFQAVFALWYYYMAKTEMFLSPILQSFCYWLFRPFMGDAAGKTEALVGKLQNLPQVPDYWNYQLQVYPGSTVANMDALKQLQEAANQSTGFDWLFKLIPTFVKDPQWMLAHAQWVTEQVARVGKGTPDMLEKCLYPGDFGLSTAADLQYRGLIDYMITNRWCWDYVNFCDRMNGHKTLSQGNITYPLEVPLLDWAWMIAAVIVMLLGFGTYFWCKQKPPAKAPETPQPTASAAR
jgi:multisubunit Na+/H+ antiporter MnhG subunit